MGKLKLIEDELVKPNNKEINSQKKRFEACLTQLPIDKTSLFIIEECQRVTIQLGKCENHALIEAYPLSTIAGYILRSDTKDSSSSEDFLQAIAEPFTYYQRIYQLIEYQKWLLHKYNSLTPSTLTEKDNILIPNLPLSEARKWFIQLAERNSKNGKPFLTTEQVEQFIERAFVGSSFLEKLTINEKLDKRNVIGLFHLFFTHCTSHHPKIGKIDKDGKAEKYIRLLTDHFDNWTFAEVSKNFRTAGGWESPI